MKRLIHRRSTLIGLGILVVICAFVLFFVGRLGLWGLSVMHQTGVTPSVAASLLFGDGVPLEAVNGRTTVLLLGVGGGDHDGPDLTDTILLLSLDNTKKSLAMVSLPRDVWSDTLKDKINSAYHYGEQQKKGNGLILARVIMEEITGMPIQYAVVVNFDGFKEVIDSVGGVDITVERSFTDTQYPIPGKEKDTCPGDPEMHCVYETVHFDAGPQHMDGARALIFVRSRHAQGVEGSDFARGKRQQLVLLALKSKLVTPKTWFTPAVGQQLLTTFQKTVKSDMNVAQMATFGKLASAIKGDRIDRVSIEDELEEGAVSQYGRFVLVPKESLEALHNFIQNSIRD